MQCDDTISFCTTCANRLHQLKQTFDQNCAVISREPRTEWIILNCNSKDGLHDFMMSRLGRLVGRIKYATVLSQKPWHMSVAKNDAHRLAKGAVLVNLDCDNFIGEAVTLIRDAFAAGADLLHFWSGTFGDGTCGRIAIKRTAFHELGGYDESFMPMGYQDRDLLDRARAKGFSVRERRIRGAMALANDKRESVKHCEAGDLSWRDFLGFNRLRSKLNIARGRLVANSGTIWNESDVRVYDGCST